MKLKKMIVYLQRNRGGVFSAHVKGAIEYGSDLFAHATIKPYTREEAQTATRCVLANMGLHVEEIQFT